MGADALQEFTIMEQHPVIGERICRPLRFATEVGPIVRGHHERWDGDGYADAPARHAIPLGARIVAVADACDTMTTDRPYRKALSGEEALKVLSEGAGPQWDRGIVDVFGFSRGAPEEKPIARIEPTGLVPQPSVSDHS
jgi:putative two-component system response regulator